MILKHKCLVLMGAYKLHIDLSKKKGTYFFPKGYEESGKFGILHNETLLDFSKFSALLVKRRKLDWLDMWLR
jgi:hypothetical protein